MNHLKLVAVCCVSFSAALATAQSPPPPYPGFQPAFQPATQQGQPQFQQPPSAQFQPGASIPPPGTPFNVQMPMALPPSSGGFNPNGSPPGFGAAQPPMNNTNFQPSSQGRTQTRSEIVAYTPKKADTTSMLVVKTSEGEFKITFKHDVAPRNVTNFLELALGQKEFVDVRTGKKVKRPFYTGLNCHRVIKSVLIQCGCPFGTGTGGPGYRVNDERSTAMRFDRPGVVAMALARVSNDKGVTYDPNSAGSQFFISLAPLPEYNDQFTVIGQVTSGMDTIRKIASTPTGPTDRPLKRVIIFSIDPDTPPVAPGTNEVSPNDAPADPMSAPMSPPMGGPSTAPIPQMPPAIPTGPTAPGAAPSAPGGTIDPFAAPPPPVNP